jgi:voltage-gated potassium channel
MADQPSSDGGPVAAPPEADQRLAQWVDRTVNRKGLRPRYAAYVVIVMWLVAIVVFGIVQRLADPHTFTSIWKAWWWAVQTVTTVGYGDVVPESTAGKAVASLLMVGGLAFLSIITATITSSFVARRQERARAGADDPLVQQLTLISERLDAIEQELRRTPPVR